VRVAVAADIRAFRTDVHGAPLGGIFGEHVGLSQPVGAAEQAASGDLQPLDGIPFRAPGDPEQPIGLCLHELWRPSQGMASHTGERYEGERDRADDTAMVEARTPIFPPIPELVAEAAPSRL
jgi:hypothetical protein